ncbi:MAG: AraC family transcriptional regulator [Peptoniphilus sp.]|uniref:AraC family transcriptional regulator n=2 Tax=Peptoniphilus indolicus TaxID=33030 RepID=G4D733_9FIRM|nr:MULTISPECIES: AraC family transcriptional regulator [Peptoniphilus]EGY76289.1 AraC family transcriptional regulator [Peptoniphilus indolicus ATCC 29427]MDY2987058.1 AraC family transcriptional regulator [Peptoniphilus sp.]SUB75691.1 Regulatory protein soxS [Peptoniphilus indolicus]
MDQKFIFNKYKISDGVFLEIYDLEIEELEYKTKNGYGDEDWTLRIDHCLNGRMEADFFKHKYSFIEAGEFAINSSKYHLISSAFPGGRYRGLSIIFHEDKMNKFNREMLSYIGVDLFNFNKCISPNKPWYTRRVSGKIEDIFTLLYIESRLETPHYIWLKIVELLYFLKLNEVEIETDFDYFSGAYIDMMKKNVNKALKSDEVVKLKELIKSTGLNTTIFYKLFYLIYGSTPANYFREYYLNLASTKLATTDKSIQSIAMEAGYNNASKFSSAFKKIYKVSPREYRKKNLILEH